MERILVVDDDPDTRQLLKLLLEMSRFDVTEASNGLEALKLFAGGHRFDLVLSDVHMPHVSGPVLRETLRSRGYPKDRVFLMTGMSGYIDPDGVTFQKGNDLHALRYIVEQLVYVAHRMEGLRAKVAA